MIPGSTTVVLPEGLGGPSSGASFAGGSLSINNLGFDQRIRKARERTINGGRESRRRFIHDSPTDDRGILRDETVFSF